MQGLWGRNRVTAPRQPATAAGRLVVIDNRYHLRDCEKIGSDTCNCGLLADILAIEAEAATPEPACPNHDPNSGPGSDQCMTCGKYADHQGTWTLWSRRSRTSVCGWTIHAGRQCVVRTRKGSPPSTPASSSRERNTHDATH